MTLTKKAERLLAATPGLHLHKGKLRVVFRLPGDKRPTKRSLGLEPTDANIQFAANKLGTIKQDLAFGLYTNDPQAFWKKHFPNEMGHTGLTTFAEATLIAYTFLEYKWSANSRASIQQSRARLLPFIGEVPVEDLSATELKKIQAQLVQSGLTPKTVNYYFGYCQHLLEAYLHQMEDKTGQSYLNPFTKVPALRLAASKRNSDDAEGDAVIPFTPEELQKILAVVSDPCKQRLIRWSVFTGMRPAEVAAMAWEDVDLEKRTVKVRYNVSRTGGHLKPPKTDHGYRVLELVPQAHAVLLELVPLTAHLTAREETCIGDYGKVTNVCRRRVFMKNLETIPVPVPPYLNLAMSTWQRILDKAGVPYRRPYQMRHTFASWSLMNGADPMWVAKQMGHSDWGMIRKIYGQWIPNTQLSPSEALGEKFESFVPYSSP